MVVLPGAVGPEQRKDLARLDLQVDAVDGEGVTVMLDQALDLDGRTRLHGPLLPLSARTDNGPIQRREPGLLVTCNRHPGPAPARRIPPLPSRPWLVGLLAVDDLLAVASAALGVTLTDPEDLGGSGRSAVRRCRLAGGGTVVVKNYPNTEEGAQSFAAEAAGLALIEQAGAGPRLLAANLPARLVVMSDLGNAPSLADVLLGRPAADAEAALLDWARACGELAVATAGRQPELAALLAVHSAERRGGWRRGRGCHAHWLERRILRIPALLGELSVPAPAGLAGDLAEVAAIARPGQPEVFSPGDICPDNNLLTAAGVRFIDFESAEFHSSSSTPRTCGCRSAPAGACSGCPTGSSGRPRASTGIWSCGIFPELASDDRWLPGVRRAMAAWTLHAMTYLLDRSMTADGQMIDDGRAAPTARQLLRYRWRQLAAELEPAGELEALCTMARGLLAATDQWQVPDLPPYPAFR